MGSPRTADNILNPSTIPHYEFAFSNFLKTEFGFNLGPSRPICKAYVNQQCALGQSCPDRHPHQSNYNNLICKHWLRGLCKKGESCEFLHEYNLRLMPECTQYARLGMCANGSDCLYLHINEDLKRPACPHYDRGFCPLGPHCALRHFKRKTFCKYYMAGFCPDGRHCTEGSHPIWREESQMRKPEPRRLPSQEELDAEQQRRQERFDKEREEDEREREERGLPGRRDNFRGRGRGRGQWRERAGGNNRGNRY